MATLLDEFRGFLKDSRGLVVWALAGGALGAVVAEFTGVAPPWPAQGAALTCAALLLALMRIFLFRRDIDLHEAQRRFTRACWALAAIVASYLTLSALFTFESTSGVRYVSGFLCTSDAASVYDTCPFLGPTPLAEAGYEAAELWTLPSIAIMRLALFACWIASFVLFMTAVALFVIYTRRREAAPR